MSGREWTPVLTPNVEIHIRGEGERSSHTKHKTRVNFSAHDHAQFNSLDRTLSYDLRRRFGHAARLSGDFPK